MIVSKVPSSLSTVINIGTGMAGPDGIKVAQIKREKETI